MYEIFYNNIEVGKALVRREGLYYHFYCECILPQSDIFKVFVTDGRTTVKLGICVPNRGKFTLKTRVPVKYLSGDKLLFYAQNNNSQKFPLRNHTCFDYLDKLDTAHLQFSDGQMYIIIS